MRSNRLFYPFFEFGSFAATTNGGVGELLPARMTRAPKILPWIARKAGISDQRSEAMWREAVRHAARLTGLAGNPDYSRVVMERLRRLVEREKLAAAAVPRDSPAATGRRAPGA